MAQQTPVLKAEVNGESTETEAEQRNGIALAVAKEAAAEAAVTTAQPTVQVSRLTRPPQYARVYHYAAIVIQTAFRGYLVRIFKSLHIYKIIRISSIVIIFL